jgi:hypothetical protein
MTDHATSGGLTAVESALREAPKRSEPPEQFKPPQLRSTEPKYTPPSIPVPSMTQVPKLNQVAALLLELPHEQIKHMSREVLSDLGTVEGRSVSDLIESLLAWSHRELKHSA